MFPDKLKLLHKPMWNYKDVKDYMHCSNDKAYALIRKARKHGGEIEINRNCCTRDSFLEMLGTSAEKELRIYGEIHNPSPRIQRPQA